MAAGGFKMSLGGLKAKPGLKAVAAKNATKPKKALLGDDEPDDTNKAQEIAGFDAAEGGAIDINGPKEKKGPLVIPALPNRNWREEARRKQLERAPHTQQQNGDVVMNEPEKEVIYGLTVPTKPAEAQEMETTQAPEEMDVDPKDDLTDAQRLEKQALESLLTGKATDTARVVPAITDEEALRNDLQDAPDEPDVAAYEATPIEGFGLAMLRGMGWKDSDGEARKNGAGGKAPAEVKRRPALLGIGAKADAAKDVELGEFNSKARGKKGQKDAAQGYNPVTLRNKKTGEVITEEELKRKLESQDLVVEKERGREGEERGERRRDRERRDDSGRDRDRDRDRDRRRDDDYDSERRRDRDRRDDRRRDKYDDDSDRRRDRRRDRDREDDYDSERWRDKRRDRDRRDRSRSRSPRDDKRRDRYRSRSRDSKDRRDRRDRSRSREDEERRRRRRKEREYEERDERRKRDREEKSSRR